MKTKLSLVVAVMAIGLLAGCAVNEGPAEKPDPIEWSDSSFSKIRAYELANEGGGYVAEVWVTVPDGSRMEERYINLITPPGVWVPDSAAPKKGRRRSLPIEATNPNGQAYPIRIYHLVNAAGQEMDALTLN